MQNKPLLCLLVLSSTLMASPAFADTEAEATEPEYMDAEYCFPTQGIVEALSKFDGLKESRRDTVGPELEVQFELDEGEIMPERVELRHEQSVTPVAIDEHFRSVGLDEQLLAAPAGTEFCVFDPAREGRLRAESGYNVDIGMGVRFKDTSGWHSLASIEDGLKDGRSHYKKMVGMMGFMVPKFDYIAVAGHDDDNPPTVFATRDGQDIGEPDFELFDGARMIALDTLEDMGADGVRIAADYYRMSPSPDAETVAKFSG